MDRNFVVSCSNLQTSVSVCLPFYFWHECSWFIGRTMYSYVGAYTGSSIFNPKIKRPWNMFSLSVSFFSKVCGITVIQIKKKKLVELGRCKHLCSKQYVVVFFNFILCLSNGKLGSFKFVKEFPTFCISIIVYVYPLDIFTQLYDFIDFGFSNRSIRRIPLWRICQNTVCCLRVRSSVHRTPVVYSLKWQTHLLTLDFVCFLILFFI